MAEATMEQMAQAIGSTFVWHENMTPNAAECKSFYMNMFGFGGDQMDMGEMGTYHMLQSNGTSIAGIMEMNGPEWEGIPPHWMIYFGVESADAATAKCESLGGSICQPPFDIPTVGRIAILKDKHGAVFGVFQPEKGG